MNAFSPDPAPTVWLCTSTGINAPDAPTWMTAEESRRLTRLSGSTRCDFVASRWLIRHGLAGMSGQDARQCRPSDGRPHQSTQPPGWYLSLSHSGGMAGCAVSSSGAIGLDVEPLTRRPQWQRVVTRWFSPREQAWLLAANDPECFLKVWTLKEAWLKATGRGIADNLQTLSITGDFELWGDRPGESWRASLGQAGNYLVAVVYQGNQIPEGFSIPGQIDSNDPGTAPSGIQPVVWAFHRQIHSATEKN